MTKDEIQQLQYVLDDGNNGVLYWITDYSPASRVISINVCDHDLSISTATLMNGRSVSLYNMNNFKLVRPVSDVFE